jgi:hypothetical protein
MHEPTSPVLTGGCQCGQARYEIRGPVQQIFVCHCRDCQKQSASAFGISVIVKNADFRLTRGEAARWSRPADSGRSVLCFFCPACGARLWHGREERSDTISIKGGGLDEPPDLTRAAHIWTRRKLSGVLIPEHAVQFPGEPP